MEEFYTIKEISSFLKISERTIWEFIADGSLASYKIKGSRRVYKKDYENFLKKYKQKGE